MPVVPYAKKSRFGPSYREDREAAEHFKKHNLARLWEKKDDETKPAEAGNTRSAERSHETE